MLNPKFMIKMILYLTNKNKIKLKIKQKELVNQIKILNHKK